MSHSPKMSLSSEARLGDPHIIVLIAGICSCIYVACELAITFHPARTSVGVFDIAAAVICAITVGLSLRGSCSLIKRRRTIGSVYMALVLMYLVADLGVTVLFLVARA